MTSSTTSGAFADAADQLSRASHYARLLRNTTDPDAALAEVLRRFDFSQVPAAPAVGLASLAVLPSATHREILSFIKALARSQIVNRSTALAPAQQRLPPDLEAARLSKYVRADTSRAIALFEGRPWFMLLERRASLPSQHFDEFPDGTRLLLDYPIEEPRLFPIACDCDFGDVCEAIADAYDKVYSSASAYGVTLHDLSDLVVENVFFFPDERLVYPHVGS